ncbi:aldehyde dehydrogenase family protein [Staphylococcus capitis]|uniref:aldehyde dehydrogenase family protein n=1 Tax=Staphylococcus capitis TaxID=29388 RepID=UPI0018871816|nr:aldehyde dehydrogenase family protein [Staphylococcus capitis]MBF2261880.1 aldehyde dehydrogenase family protein [Staphylococcus capitis]MBF2282687.1 aldehyde dehydrogenase family protein [Staphylococcus capitis]
MLNYTKQFINGKWVESHSKKTINIFNPANEEVIAKIAAGDETDVNYAIESANKVENEFRKSSLEYRKEILLKISEVYKRRMEDLINAISMDLGSPISKTKASQVEVGYKHFVTAIEMIDKLQFREQRGNALVMKEAIGTSALITPWNYPANQPATKIASSLAAGCPIILKPSEITPLASIILAEIIEEANIPDGYFNLINGYGNEVGDLLSKSINIRMISFTGSTDTGAKIMKNATSNFKKVALEMGGKSPLIVLDDQNIEENAELAVMKVMTNSGQICTAATRTLIPENMKEKFYSLVKEKVENLKLQLPNKTESEIGPVVSQKQYDKIQFYINKGIEEGAKILTGGSGKPQGLEKGYFVKPTVFIDVKNNMTIAQEEIFGPVMSIITYNTIDEAIKIANDTEYGLSSYVIGQNLETVRKVAESIDSGTVETNNISKNLTLPFGGYKSSGIGREWGDFGIEEFLEVKAISGYFTTE